MKKYCGFCGQPFEPKHGNMKYCSKKCFKDGQGEIHKQYYRKRRNKEYWREYQKKMKSAPPASPKKMRECNIRHLREAPTEKFAKMLSKILSKDLRLIFSREV